jgi:dihydroxyacetone kinase
LLVSRLLAELPEGVRLDQDRAVVLLNGLGSCKYEELFVLFAAVARQLEAAGVVIADSECGELVTSLDMAGLSLSLFWVDDELLELWQAPADAAAYRRCGLAQRRAEDLAVLEPASTLPPAIAAVITAFDAPSHPSPIAVHRQALALATPLLERLVRVQQALTAAEPELGHLDAQAGDGDHGLAMVRGATGAVAAAEQVVASGGDGITLLLAAAEAWSEEGGGTSGAIWGAALAGAASSLAAALAEPETHLQLAIADALDGALAAVKELGKAEPGDKTLVDALQPLAVGYRQAIENGAELAAAWHQAATAATTAAVASAQLLPRLGRARPHAERSLGFADAGATSLALCARAVEA